MIASKLPWRRFFVLALLLSLALAVGCGQVFLDPGPNPAKVRVKLKAQVPANLKNYPSEWIYWDWGLFLAVPQGPLPLLKPTVDQGFKVIANVNPLVRDTVFLAPAGKHTFKLEISGYALRERGENTVPVTLLNFNKKYTLDLPPGGSHTIELNLGAP